jgi:hypothetical protein
MSFFDIVGLVFGILLAFFLNRIILPFLLSQPNSLVVLAGIILLALEAVVAIWFIIYGVCHFHDKNKSSQPTQVKE